MSKKNIFHENGISSDTLDYYEDELLDKAKNVLFFDIPFDIILMSTIMTNGFCHNVSKELAKLINNSTLVEANINMLAKYNNARHAFIISDDFVYDTSIGYKIQKDFYFERQNPYNIIKDKEFMTLEELTFDQFFSKVMYNINNEDNDYYYVLHNYLLSNIEEVLSTKENTINFFLEIAKHFANDSIYKERLLQSINEFETKIITNIKQKKEKKIMTPEEIQYRTYNLIDYGLKNNLIDLYEDEIFDITKNILFNEIPLDIILMSTVATDGMCFDFASILHDLYDDSKLIEADVLSLVNDICPKHAFIIKNNYVYDTSRGYKINKNLYFELEKPKNIITNKDNMFLKKLSFNQFFSKIILNVQQRDEALYASLMNDLESNKEEIFKTKESTIKFILNIIKTYSYESFYEDKLLKSIRNFEKNLHFGGRSF